MVKRHVKKEKENSGFMSKTTRSFFDKVLTTFEVVL